MTSSFRRVISIAAALTVLGAPLLTARQDRPSFRSSTRLVELSVVVTDRDRNPVPGLTAGDFQIFDDGKPQRVELFSVEGISTATPVPPAPPRRAREFSNKLPATGSVTIILYDQWNTPDAVRMNVREHVARFLEQIRPDDRVGLYVLTATASCASLTISPATRARSFAPFRGSAGTSPSRSRPRKMARGWTQNSASCSRTIRRRAT